MDALPKELTAPIHFLKGIKHLYLSDELLSGWTKIADDFELTSLSPIYGPVAKKITEVIAESIDYFNDKRKSDFKFPDTITEHVVKEWGTIQYYNEETFEMEERPDLSLMENKRKLSEEDKKRIWKNFNEMLNRFRGICSVHGFTFDASLSEEFIKGLVYLEISDKPFIDHRCREDFYNALAGDIPETKFSSLKIEVIINIGEATYILDRIRKSGNAPILEKLITAGAFWKLKKLTWIDTRKERTRFIKDAKKIIIKTEIDEKVDQLLSMI